MASSLTLGALQRTTFIPLQWCVILIGLFVPTSVALDNIMLGFIFLGALFSLGGISRVAVSNPVARAALMLFAALLIAVFYGATPLKEALGVLMKYVDLMFVPVFMYLLNDDKVRRRARYAFMAAMALTLLLSYLVGLHILPIMSWMDKHIAPDNPVIFHSHITQNNFMAFAILLALLECREASTRGLKIAWAVFALLGTANILFMVYGRTGYLLLLTLLGWFAWTTLARRLHQRGRVLTWRQQSLLAAVLLSLSVGIFYASPRLHDRVMQGVSQYQAWTQGHGTNTSIGDRIDFFTNTLEIVRDHPLAGVGTGGLPAAYELQTQGKNLMQTRNPHSEYLMISVQTGIVGFALLLFLFYTQWRYAPALSSPFEQDAARGLMLAFLVGCLINSSLMDHSEGLFFAFMTAVLFSNLKTGTKHD